MTRSLFVTFVAMHSDDHFAGRPAVAVAGANAAWPVYSASRWARRTGTTVARPLPLALAELREERPAGGVLAWSVVVVVEHRCGRETFGRSARSAETPAGVHRPAVAA